MRLPKLLVSANLISPEPPPGTPGILVHVQLRHDRDRGWWEVTVRETGEDKRKAMQRFQSEPEAEAALNRVYALFGSEGRWEIQRYE
jgi:hypothetical protein